MKKSKVKFFRVNKLGETIAVLEDGVSMNARVSKSLKVGDEVSYTPVAIGDKYTKDGVEHVHEYAFNKFEGFVPAVQNLQLKYAELQLASIM